MTVRTPAVTAAWNTSSRSLLPSVNLVWAVGAVNPFASRASRKPFGSVTRLKGSTCVSPISASFASVPRRSSANAPRTEYNCTDSAGSAPMVFSVSHRRELLPPAKIP